ncbi:AsmA family protein [Vibrio sinaloensis]|nr:AsmA family protein [Vibrio sinaloensis]
MEWQNDQQLGWQNGQLEVSANNASFDKLLTTQMVIQAVANQGKLTLERAFLPLKTGYIEASGQWDRASASRPWTLSIHADGVPSDINSLQSALPFSTQGQIEVSGEFFWLSR